MFQKAWWVQRGTGQEEVGRPEEPHGGRRGDA